MVFQSPSVSPLRVGQASFPTSPRAPGAHESVVGSATRTGLSALCWPPEVGSLLVCVVGSKMMLQDAGARGPVRTLRFFAGDVIVVASHYVDRYSYTRAMVMCLDGDTVDMSDVSALSFHRLSA
jgi:hypothetical protein